MEGLADFGPPWDGNTDGDSVVLLGKLLIFINLMILFFGLETTR